MSCRISSTVTRLRLVVAGDPLDHGGDDVVGFGGFRVGPAETVETACLGVVRGHHHDVPAYLLARGERHVCQLLSTVERDYRLSASNTRESSNRGQIEHA